VQQEIKKRKKEKKGSMGGKEKIPRL